MSIDEDWEFNDDGELVLCDCKSNQWKDCNWRSQLFNKKCTLAENTCPFNTDPEVKKNREDKELQKAMALLTTVAKKDIPPYHFKILMNCFTCIADTRGIKVKFEV